MTRRGIAIAVFMLWAGCSWGQDGVGTALRASLSLNGTWQYVLNQSQNQIPSSGWTNTRIPAAPLIDGTFSVWYQRNIFIPLTWVVPGRRFFIELEKSGHYAAIYMNGQLMGDHYGQFSPFEIEVTPAILGGVNNQVSVYVHDADSTYTRRGATLDQSGCANNNPNCKGNSYRPGAATTTQRNWVGLMGDITFSWRPGEYISDTQIITSVRNSTLTANLSILGAGPNAKVSAAVLDAGVDVLDLPAQAVASGVASLVATWTNPVLWSPGAPKLYTLRITLNDNGRIVDTTYTRFGFREVWIAGKTLLLNGQPLWMVGDYWSRMAPIRTQNDRRPVAMMLNIQQQSGVNAMHSHWDDGGRAMLDLADEMGIPVVGSFYCNSTLYGQSHVDSSSAWTAWMKATATEWAHAERNHPSLLLWRPMDVIPSGAIPATIYPALADGIHAVDTTRPIADGSDVDTWPQNAVSDTDPTTCDDGSALAAKLEGETKPLLIREVYGLLQLPCGASFLSTIYGVAYTGGGAGLLTQHLDLFDPESFTVTWPSMSGIGNRTATSDELPNWFTRQWSATQWSPLLAGLYTDYLGLSLPDTSPTSGEYLATNLPSQAGTAFLIPPNRTGEPVGVAVADDLTAWFVTKTPGNNLLMFSNGTADVQQKVTALPPAPF